MWTAPAGWNVSERNMVKADLCLNDGSVLREKIAGLLSEYRVLLDNITRTAGKDPRSLPSLLKRLAEIEPVVQDYQKLEALSFRIADYQNMIQSEKDPEMKMLVREELNAVKQQYEQLQQSIARRLSPGQADDEKNALVEIRQGTGGQEACLFARDLFRMYTRYCQKHGYQVEIFNSHVSEKGGFKEIIFLVKGRGAYGRLKYESGVHRVQRVPETESSGRIHTSAATVAVLPEVQEEEVFIDPKDLKIDTFCSSGAGGQHVNKTASAVRITHLPTGIVVTCQDERSQIQNRSRALKILRARLQQLSKSELKRRLDTERRMQVKTGDRSEKIRTYNFPQNRVTDHRLGLTIYQLDAVLDGEIDELVEGCRKAAEEI